MGTKCNFIKISNLLYKVALHQSEQYCTTAMHADFSHPFLLSSPVQFEICSRSPSFNDHGHGLGPQFYIQLLFIATPPFTLKFDNVLPMEKKLPSKMQDTWAKLKTFSLATAQTAQKQNFVLRMWFIYQLQIKVGIWGLSMGVWLL